MKAAVLAALGLAFPATEARAQVPPSAGDLELRGHPRRRLGAPFGVYGASAGRGTPPRVTSAWELRRGAELVHEEPPTGIAPTPEGALVRLFGLSLEDAEPGGYSLTLRVTDEGTGETVARTEEFEIS